MASLLISELDEMKKAYGTGRRTALENAGEIIIEEKKIEEEEVVFCLDRFGYAKILDVSVYEKNKEAADADNKYVFRVMNTDKVCLFSDIGKMHTIKVLDVPRKKLREKGIPVDNLSNFETAREELLYAAPLAEVQKSELFFATEKGFVKRTGGAEFVSSVRTIQSTKLQEGDRLILVSPDDQLEFCVLMSHEGYFLKFAVSEASELKKTAVGVKGMALSGSDRIERAYLIGSAHEFSVDYRGGKVFMNRLKLAKRGGKGTKKK